MKKKSNDKPRPADRGKSLWRRITCLLLLAVLVAGMAFGADAATIILNGVGGSGIPGATNSAVGAYNIFDDDGKVLGYRFTLLDANNEKHGAPTDVYISSYMSSLLTSASSTLTIAKDKANNYTRMSKLDYMGKYTTLQLKLESTTGTSPSAHVDKYSKLDTTVGLTLPATAAEMEGWPGDVNLTTLLSALWNTSFATAVNNKYELCIEPIYAVKIGGSWFGLTVAEMGIMAHENGTVHDGDTSWDAVTGSAANVGSWKNIAYYTHCDWPMALTLQEDAFGVDVSAYPDLERGYGKRATDRQLVTGKYGVMQVKLAQTVNTYNNTIGHWVSGFTNGEGSNASGDWFLLKYSYYYGVAAGTQYAMTDAYAAKIPNGVYLYNYFGYYDSAGNWVSSHTLDTPGGVSLQECPQGAAYSASI